MGLVLGTNLTRKSMDQNFIEQVGDGSARWTEDWSNEELRRDGGPRTSVGGQQSSEASGIGMSYQWLPEAPRRLPGHPAAVNAFVPSFSRLLFCPNLFTIYIYIYMWKKKIKFNCRRDWGWLLPILIWNILRRKTRFIFTPWSLVWGEQDCQQGG